MTRRGHGRRWIRPPRPVGTRRERAPQCLLASAEPERLRDWYVAAYEGARSGEPPSPLAGAQVAVRLPAQDLDRARAWYAERLGLEPADERDGGLLYALGDAGFVVFASSGRAPGDHTQMAITVSDLDAAVAGLRERGVRFESEPVDVEGHNPSLGATGERATWFRDSEGNLLGMSEPTY